MRQMMYPDCKTTHKHLYYSADQTLGNLITHDTDCKESSINPLLNILVWSAYLWFILNAIYVGQD